MYGDNSHNMPIGLAMSLSTNKEAFRVFLNMTNEEQDNFINHAREMKSIVELNKMVNELPRTMGK